MNILCISSLDNGGQMQALSNALNKYTNHHSQHFNLFETFLDYDVDIKYSQCTDDKIYSLINNSNFFIFSEEIPHRLQKLGILNKLHRNNMIIRCFGSVTRENTTYYRDWWNSHFGTFTSGGLDPTIHPYLGFVAYHIPNLYEFNKFPKINKNKPLKICHNFTTTESKKTKNTDEVIKTLDMIKEKYDIESVIINNKSWKDSLKIKAKCHITIDQFNIGVYANSATESMYLKHAVISRISPIVKSFHPDLPIVQATVDNLYYVIEDLLLNPTKIKTIGNLGHEYAIREHSAELNIIKWEHLIKWVSEGFK